MAFTLTFCVTLTKHFSSLGLSYLLLNMAELDSGMASVGDPSVLRAGILSQITPPLSQSLRSLPKQRLFQTATPSCVDSICHL